jgi:hypothetical protein
MQTLAVGAGGLDGVYLDMQSPLLHWPELQALVQ